MRNLINIIIILFGLYLLGGIWVYDRLSESAKKFLRYLIDIVIILPWMAMAFMDILL